MFKVIFELKTNLVGDLGYKSAGSRYPHTCTFEVSKSEDSVVPMGNENMKEKPSMIKITIPTELEGTAYIQVTIQKGMQLFHFLYVF